MSRWKSSCGRADLRCGDSLRIMPTLDADSVDAIVTDPPYGLTFMGKEWDRGVPGVEFWREAYRVAKPGAHLLAFGGTRTYHRQTCAIEDAGWEIRDCIMWVYGSGFPKSLDVSKAIDRMDASEEQERRRLRFTAWVRGTGATSRQIDEATGTNMGGHYTTAASQPRIMTREHLEKCRHLLGDVPQWVEHEADIRSVESRNMAEREVVGQKTAGIANPDDRDRHTVGGSASVVVDITAPATRAAQQWSGWGTALKPAVEPIVLARKPLQGTVAANVLRHGTGAINVDGCKVVRHCESDRWPANLIHDGSDEVLDGFPQDGESSSARFFYCAKADGEDRDHGNTHPTVKPNDLMRYLIKLIAPKDALILDPFMGSGSTGVAAIQMHNRFIGIELGEDHFEICKRRVAAAFDTFPLLNIGQEGQTLSA